MSHLNLTVSKRYGEKEIFRNFTFSAPKNKITCVLGASGSGKTTLLRILSGMTDFTGEITGKGTGVSVVFQEDRLVPALTVRQNLRLIAGGKKADEQINRILSYLEIEGEADRYPDRLSGGQRQRVSLARAFLYPSDLLLLDEPFHSLDLALTHRLLGVLLKLQSLTPKTVVYVTHGVDEALLAADEIVVIGGNPATVLYQTELSLPKSERTLSMPELVAVRETIVSTLTQEKGERL